MKLQQRVDWLTAIILASILVIIALLFYSQSKQTKLLSLELGVIHTRELVADLEHKTIDLRVNRDTTQIQLFKKLNSHIDSIAGDITKEIGESELIRSFIAEKNSYSSLFDSLKTLIVQMGISEKEGERGTLRSTVHKVEEDLDQVNDNLLRAMMLQLRRREKDFIIRSDVSYLNKFNTDLQAFKDSVSISIYNEEIKSKLQNDIDMYSSSFKAFVAASEKIGLSDDTGIRGDLKKSYEKMTSLLAQLSEGMKKDLQKRKNSVRMAIAFLVGALILALLFSMRILLKKVIITDLKKLESVIREMTQGNLKVKTEIKRTDEIGSLAEMLDSLALQLHESNIDSDQKKVLIEEFHAPVFLVNSNGEIQMKNSAADSFFFGAVDKGMSLSILLQSSPVLDIYRSDEQRLVLSDTRIVDVRVLPLVTDSLDEQIFGVVLADVTSTSQIAQSISDTVENLTSIVKSLKESSHSVEQHSNEMLSYSEEVSTETSAMANNLTNNAANLANNSGQVTNVSTSLQETVGVLNEIKTQTSEAQELTSSAVDAVDNISRKSDELKESVESITAFIQTISEISEQTQLLALNATIEAARAGDAGKGFAVVANEVKELSMQTSRAADDIKYRVDQVNAVSETTGNAVSLISEVIEKLNALVIEITRAVDMQSSSANEISQRVIATAEDISGVSDQISQSGTLMNKLSGESDELTRGAGDLNKNSSELRGFSSELDNVTQKLYELIKTLKQ